MGLRQLLAKAKGEVATAEIEVRKAEEAVQKAEIERAKAEAAIEREKRSKKTWKEKLQDQAETALTVVAAIPAATGIRAIRKRVNLQPKGIDLGGLMAAGTFVGAVATTGKRWIGSGMAGAAAGFASEFFLNKMDPTTPAKDDKQKTSGLEEGDDEEAGALPPARRNTLRERMRRIREHEERIDASDVIDMP